MLNYLIDCVLLLVSYIFLVVGVMVGVAFLVLLERKVLGYVQLRKGPNSVGYMGWFQSFGDAVKLFIKEPFNLFNSNYLIYYVSPIFSLFMVLLIWLIFPFFSTLLSFFYAGVFFFAVASVGVYTLMGSGWSSNSNYALLGAIRGVAQTISYEVSMMLIFLGVVFLVKSYCFYDLFFTQVLVWNFFMFFPLFLCWVTSILAETNRTPFDFAEGESELVSGFNIEYGSGGFALLFLAEYGSIIFMSYIVVFLFMGGLGVSFWLVSITGVVLCFWFIWVRGTLPRYRYDKLMGLAWKSFLPISLFFLFFYFGLILV